MRIHLLCCVLLRCVLLLQAQDPPPGEKAAAVKPYKLGGPVFEELSLPDLAGKTHALFAENEGKALVLVFWSYRDPVSRFYTQTLTELQSAHADKLAVVLVDSNLDELKVNGDPLVKIREVVRSDNVTLPLLLDHDNRIADDFAANANGQAFLIDANRFLRYQGGIDDDPRGERRKQGTAVQPWLAKAVEIVLKGERPIDNWTRPAGRPIKRPQRGAPAAEAPGQPPEKPPEKPKQR